MEAGEPQKTMLMAYFRFNAENPEIGKNYTYETFGIAYWYDDTTNTWYEREHRRKNHIIRIGKVYSKDPEAQVKEFYHIFTYIFNGLKALRLLLLNVKGPTSFASLYGRHKTFVDAAKERNYIENPRHWIQTIQEAFDEIWSMRRRYTYMAQLLATSEIPSIYEVVDTITLTKQAPLLPQNMEKKSADEKLEYVLKRLDLVLRAMATSCEAIGLPKQNQRLSESSIIDVI
jgi:hypothetical protein